MVLGVAQELNSARSWAFAKGSYGHDWHTHFEEQSSNRDNSPLLSHPNDALSPQSKPITWPALSNGVAISLDLRIASKVVTTMSYPLQRLVVDVRLQDICASLATGQHQSL
jgi:hypothetical protein